MDAAHGDAGHGRRDEQRGRRGLERLRSITHGCSTRHLPCPARSGASASMRCSAWCRASATSPGGIVAVYALRVARNLSAPPVIQLHMLEQHRARCAHRHGADPGRPVRFRVQGADAQPRAARRFVATPHKTARRSRRGVLLMPIAIVVVFATLTALGIWMLVILFHWLGSLFAAA